LCTHKRIIGARYEIGKNFNSTPSITEVVREHQNQSPQFSILWWTFASKRGFWTHRASCSLGVGRVVPWDKVAKCESDHSHQLPSLRYIPFLTDMTWWSAQLQSYRLLYIIICPLRQQEPCRSGVQHYSDHWRLVLICILKLLSCYP